VRTASICGKQKNRIEVESGLKIYLYTLAERIVMIDALRESNARCGSSVYAEPDLLPTWLAIVGYDGPAPGLV
jgi:hypothetical protein